MSGYCAYCQSEAHRLRKISGKPEIRRLFKKLQDDDVVCTKCYKKAKYLHRSRQNIKESKHIHDAKISIKDSVTVDHDEEKKTASAVDKDVDALMCVKRAHEQQMKQRGYLVPKYKTVENLSDENNDVQVQSPSIIKFKRIRKDERTAGSEKATDKSIVNNALEESCVIVGKYHLPIEATSTVPVVQHKITDFFKNQNDTKRASKIRGLIPNIDKEVKQDTTSTENSKDVIKPKGLSRFVSQLNDTRDSIDMMSAGIAYNKTHTHNQDIADDQESFHLSFEDSSNYILLLDLNVNVERLSTTMIEKYTKRKRSNVFDEIDQEMEQIIESPCSKEIEESMAASKISTKESVTKVSKQSHSNANTRVEVPLKRVKATTCESRMILPEQIPICKSDVKRKNPFKVTSENAKRTGFNEINELCTTTKIKNILLGCGNATSGRTNAERDFTTSNKEVQASNYKNILNNNRESKKPVVEKVVAEKNMLQSSSSHLSTLHSHINVTVPFAEDNNIICKSSVIDDNTLNKRIDGNVNIAEEKQLFKSSFSNLKTSNNKRMKAKDDTKIDTNEKKYQTALNHVRALTEKDREALFRYLLNKRQRFNLDIGDRSSATHINEFLSLHKSQSRKVQGNLNQNTEWIDNIRPIPENINESVFIEDVNSQNKQIGTENIFGEPIVQMSQSQPICVIQSVMHSQNILFTPTKDVPNAQVHDQTHLQVITESPNKSNINSTEPDSVENIHSVTATGFANEIFISQFNFNSQKSAHDSNVNLVSRMQNTPVQTELDEQIPSPEKTPSELANSNDKQTNIKFGPEIPTGYVTLPQSCWPMGRVKLKEKSLHIWAKPYKLLYRQTSSDAKFQLSIGQLLLIDINKMTWNVYCSVEDELGFYHRSYKNVQSLADPVCLTEGCKFTEPFLKCSTVLSVGMCDLEINGQSAHRTMLNLPIDHWGCAMELLYSLGNFYYNRNKKDQNDMPIQARVLQIIVQTAPKIGNFFVLFQNVNKTAKKTDLNANLHGIELSVENAVNVLVPTTSKIAYGMKAKTKEFLLEMREQWLGLRKQNVFKKKI